MHDQRSDGPEPPAHGTRAHEVQRKLLLELVLAPPPFTDDLAELSDRIGEPLADVAAALAALARAGLAGREGGDAWATPAARYCEALYPMCPLTRAFRRLVRSTRSARRRRCSAPATLRHNIDSGRASGVIEDVHAAVASPNVRGVQNGFSTTWDWSFTSLR